MVFHRSQPDFLAQHNDSFASLSNTGSTPNLKTSGLVGILTAIATGLGLTPPSALALDSKLASDAIALLALGTGSINEEHTKEWLSLAENLSQTAYSISAPERKGTLLLDLAAAYASLGAEDKAVTVMKTALANVHEIEDEWQRERMLRRIAELAIALEHHAQTIELLKAVIFTARTISEDRGNAMMLDMMNQWGPQYFDSEQTFILLESSLSAAYALDDPRNQVTAVGNIAKIYNTFGDPQRAAELLAAALQRVSTIDDESCKLCEFRSLLKIANALSVPYRPEALDHAFKVVGILKRPEHQAKALVDVASAYGGLGREFLATTLLDAAVLTATDLSDPSSQSDILVDIANTYSQLDCSSQASALLDRSLAIAAQIEAPSEKIRRFLDIAIAYDTLGHPNHRATQMANSFNAAIAIAAQNREGSRGNALAQIAWSTGQLSQDSDKISLLKSIVATIIALDNANAQSIGLSAVINAIQHLETEEGIIELLTTTIAVIQMVDVDEHYMQEFIGVFASAVENFSHPQQATRLLQATLPLVYSTPTDEMVWHRIAPLIFAVQTLPQGTQQQNLLDDILAIIATLDGSSQTVQVLSQMAIAYGRVGLHVPSTETLDKAMAIAHTLTEPTARIHGLLSVAQAAAYLDDDQRIEAILISERPIIMAIEDARLKVWALSVMASLYDQIGDEENSLFMLESAFDYVQTRPVEETGLEVISVINYAMQKWGWGFHPQNAQNVSMMQKLIILVDTLESDAIKGYMVANLIYPVNMLEPETEVIAALQSLLAISQTIDNEVGREQILGAIAASMTAQVQP